MRQLPKHKLCFAISYGQTSLQVPLQQQATLPLLPYDNNFIRIEATTAESQVRIGSVSIPQHIVLGGGLASYQQWVTLFEYADDDEYDGAMGLNDEEEPKVLLHLTTDLLKSPSTQKKRQKQRSSEHHSSQPSLHESDRSAS